MKKVDNMKFKFRLAITFVLALCVLTVPAAAFAAPTTNLSIPVEQIFSATQGIVREGTFAYELTRLNPTHPLPEGATGNTYSFTITGTDTVDVGPITFTHGGMFSYEIRSVATPTAGFVLDTRIYTVFIAVTNTPTGGLASEIHAVFVRDAGQAGPGTKVADGRIVFDKGYGALASRPDDKIDPPVVKTVQGNPARDYTFTFRLTPQGDTPMPPGATGEFIEISITGSGRAYFGTDWSYTVGGTFVYEIREIASNNPDYRFDTTVYILTDTVTSEAGQLVVERTLRNAATNALVTSMTFINTYTGEPKVQETPGGTTRPGPKTGDYADPAAMMIAMALSAAIVAFTLFLIYIDRRSEEEHPCSEGMAAA